MKKHTVVARFVKLVTVGESAKAVVAQPLAMTESHAEYVMVVVAVKPVGVQVTHD